MKILFITKKLIMEPLGIMSLSASLKAHNHTVDLCRLDLNQPDDYLEDPYDFVCYSVCSGSEQFYLDLNNQLKQKYSFKSVFGGPAVTFTPEVFQVENVDYQVRGEGEAAILAIINGERHEDLRLIDLDSTPDVDRDLAYDFIDLGSNPIKNIMTRRGCQYACSYCFNRTWNHLHKDQLPKKVVRYRSVDRVIAEGERLREFPPLRLVNFVDDNFASSVEWLQEFATKWRNKVGVPFFCSVRPEDATEEVFSLLKDAGCVIANMAIEAANDYTRRNILTRTGTKDSVLKALELAHSYGIRTRLQNIIGLPVRDPWSDALETLDFNLLAKPTSSWCAILQAYRGTKVYEIAFKSGYVNDKDLVDEGFFGESKLNIKHKKKIFRLHKLWPLVTVFPRLRKLVPVMVRLPLPNSVFNWIFRVTKKRYAERDLWAVFN